MLKVILGGVFVCGSLIYAVDMEKGIKSPTETTLSTFSSTEQSSRSDEQQLAPVSKKISDQSLGQGERQASGKLPHIKASLRELEQLGDKIMVYYKSPNPEEVGDYLDDMIAFDVLDDPQRVLSYLGFIVEVFGRNESYLPRWMKKVDMLPIKSQEPWLYALRMSNSPTSQRMILEGMKKPGDLGKMYKLLNNMPVEAMMTLESLEKEPLAPEHLDYCWSSFFASGDPKFVVFVLRKATSPTRPNEIDMTRNAARWSARALIHQDVTIRKIAEKFLKNYPQSEQDYFLKPL